MPRRGEQGPKTIDQIHKDAEAEEHREQIKVQQLMSGKVMGGRSGSGGGGKLAAEDELLAQERAHGVLRGERAARR